MEAVDVFDHFDSNLPSKAFSVFQQMRESGELCDVTIKTGLASVTAHRLVLAAVMPYFRSAFNSTSAEGVKTEMTLDCVHPTALQHLTSFAYTGKLRIETTTVEILLTTSIFLQFNSAIDACFQFLLRRLNPAVVLKIREFAESVSHANMLESTDRYVRENFEEVSMSEAFLSLPFPVLKELISRDDLFVVKEEVVLEAVIRWVKAKEQERAVYLPELMSHIRVPLMAPEYIETRVYTEKLISESLLCGNILDGMPPSNFGVSERYCKEKHHLKCARIMGCAMYCVCPSTEETYSLKYFDCIHQKWLHLYSLPKFYSASSDASYVVCTEENLFFIKNKHVCILCLKTLELTSLDCECNIPVSAGVTLQNGKLYFFGGSGDSLEHVQCLYPQQVTCLVVGKMTTGRVNPGVVSLGYNVYVTGGRPDRDDSSDEAADYDDRGGNFEDEDDDDTHDDVSSAPLSCYTSAEMYNSLTRQSVKISPMLKGRYSHGCASLNGKVYVCGGYSNDSETLVSVEVYNPLSDQWNFVASLNDTVKPVISLASYAGQLYAVHNASTHSVCPVEIYDPESNEWKIGEHIHTAGTHYERVILVVTATASRLK